MPPSFEQLFLNKVAAAAARCAADTGLWTSVVLAQWADETAWGTSRAWIVGNNPAGISPGGSIANYPSESAGFAAYIETMDLEYYAKVRAAKPEGNIAQAYALGASPWAGGHYTARGGQPGSSLVALIESMDLSAYDGAEEILAKPPAPAVTQEEEMNPFVAEISGQPGQFIVWPNGTKSFIADGADVPVLKAQFGQTDQVNLTAGTLAQIPNAATIAPPPAPVAA